MAMRKVTYKLYPNKQQLAELERHTELHRALYNAALQERIEANRKNGVSISLGDQSASLTQIRNEDPEYKRLPRKALVHTLERLDRAFAKFFERNRAGLKGGFPRFKSKDRFKGFGFRVHRDGARFDPGEDGRHGRLYVRDIPGLIKARGRPREIGTIKDLCITRKADQWFVVVTMEVEANRTSGGDVFAFDWGVETYVTGLSSNDEIVIFDNDRVGKRHRAKLVKLSRQLARQIRGSKRRERTKLQLSREQRRLANARKDRAHKTSAHILSRSCVVAFEKLTPSNMTRSARGTADAPGRNVRQKAGLNREVLDTAPGALMTMIKYKAEEAGVWILEAPTGQLKPSQRCPSCNTVKKKTLDQRVHSCPCGYEEPRDLASARVVLNWAMEGLGREPVTRDGLALAA